MLKHSHNPKIITHPLICRHILKHGTNGLGCWFRVFLIFCSHLIPYHSRYSFVINMWIKYCGLQYNDTKGQKCQSLDASLLAGQALHLGPQKHEYIAIFSVEKMSGYECARAMRKRLELAQAYDECRGNKRNES